MEFTVDDMINAFKAGVKVATTKSDEEIKVILQTLEKSPELHEGSETYRDIRAKWVAIRKSLPTGAGGTLVNSVNFSKFLDTFYYKPHPKPKDEKGNVV